MSTRILVVEDHPIVALGLKTVIDAQPDMSVVGEADSMERAITLASELAPDLAVLPLRLGGELSGIELCRELKGMELRPKVLIYTAYNSSEDASASFLSGADSFVNKREDSARLLETIRTTAAGHRTWLLGVEGRDEPDRFSATMEAAGLTNREREVLGFMLQRFTNAEISRELFIELPTVKTHVSNILSKLGLRSRKELL